jgi:quercetin dioxygenase-like cupin family protein
MRHLPTRSDTYSNTANTVKQTYNASRVDKPISSVSIGTRTRKEGPPMNTMHPYKRSPALDNSKWYKGILISELATSSDTNGAMDFVESKMRKGTEPPPHVHDREDELFYVLKGALRVFAAGEVFNVEAGETVFLPRQVPHAYLIQSEDCHVLALITPGGFINAVNKMNAPARTMDIPSDMETYATADLAATVAIFTQYGVRMLSPEEIAQHLPAYPLTR